MKRYFVPFLVLIFSSLLSGHNISKDENTDITISYIAGNIYMLQGRGGNIGLSIGNDGILVVDDQYADLSDTIKDAIKKINPGRIKFLFNTHHHGDHTGGNANFAKEAIIIAHRNVRKRLIADSSKIKEDFPIITFEDSISVYFNGEEIKAIHLPNGHTDGDIAIYFTSSNVIHMGDQFFNGGLPYMDLDSGGNAENYAKNIEYILSIIPDNIKIIPGHGPLATKEDLKKVFRMVSDNVNYVNDLINKGKSLEEIQSLGVLAPYKQEANQWMTEEMWLKILYRSIKDK